MRVRTSKECFRLAGRLLPVGSLYINEPMRLTAYVDDFQIHTGTKSGNHYLCGHMFIDGRWIRATFFETGTIFVGSTRFGGGRFPEIYYDFWKKLPAAKRAKPSKYVGMYDNIPSEPHSRIADITPTHNTAYELKKLNIDNADTWTFGGKITSSGTDTPLWAATGKTVATVARTKQKDYSRKENYVPRESSIKTKKRSEYLDQFNADDVAEVIFRDSMFALRDNYC